MLGGKADVPVGEDVVVLVVVPGLEDVGHVQVPGVVRATVPEGKGWGEERETPLKLVHTKSALHLKSTEGFLAGLFEVSGAGAFGKTVATTS